VTGQTNRQIQHSTTFEQGRFIKRYKRFFAEVELPQKGLITAHCPNTGSMKGCLKEGAPVYISLSSNRKRKLPYTLEAIKPEKAWIGVNTHRPNHLVKEWIARGCFPELGKITSLRSEVKVGSQMRVDLELTHPGQKRSLVEIKNVTYKDDRGFAAFPDAETKRGQKHAEELTELHQDEMIQSYFLFLINRNDCKAFRPAQEIDRAYAAKLRKAFDGGVGVLAYSSALDGCGITLGDALPIRW
jgi:sugar fermentation stimulation protein A